MNNTYSLLMEEFADYKKNMQECADDTVNEYLLDLRLFFRFIKIDRGIFCIDDIDSIPVDDVDIEFASHISDADVRHFIDFLKTDRPGLLGLGLSDTSVNRKKISLKVFFSYLYDVKEAIPVNPCKNVLLKKISEPDPFFYNEADSIRLLDAIDGQNKTRDYCIILMALICGFRVGEICGLNIDDVFVRDFDYVVQFTGKGDKIRKVVLPDNCVKALKDYLAIRETMYHPVNPSERALFLSRRGFRISSDAIQVMLKKTAKKAFNGDLEGSKIKKCTPHKLRHTAASLMLKSGVDLRSIQEVLGHSSMEMERRYAHVDNEMLKSAISSNPLSKKE